MSARPPRLPLSQRTYSLFTVGAVALTAFMTGWLVSGIFAPPPGAAPAVASDLPSGHPPVDPNAPVPAPPLTPEQMAKAPGATPKANPASNAPSAPMDDSHDHADEYDQNFDDPAIRAMIEGATDFATLVRIGNEQFDQKHPKPAILAYEKALKLQPNDPNVLTDLGVMYRAVHRHDDALNAFRKAARLDPKHAQSRYNVGIVLAFDNKDYSGAIQAWEDYLKVEPNGSHSDEVRRRIADLRKTLASKG